MSIKGDILEHVILQDVVLAIVETVHLNVIHYNIVELKLEHEPVVLRTRMSLYSARSVLNEEVYYRTIYRENIRYKTSNNTRTIDYRSI